jgi:hypothetical protein
MRGNASGAAPQSWVILDTETLPVRLDATRWQHTFRLATATYWRVQRENNPEIITRAAFTSAPTLVDWITSRVHSKERIGVVAHNMDFDWQVSNVSDDLARRGWQPTRIILERGKWSQHWRSNAGVPGPRNASILGLDLCNFYPAPLRELAPMVGMVKFPMPEFSEPDEVWLRHCANDTEIAFRLLRRWLEFRKEHDLGYFAATIAGQAFNAYRHRFMEHPIYVHVHKDVLAVERASYFAGRCETFFRGKAPRGWYALVDSTSFYASVMKGNYFPARQVGHARRTSVPRLAELLENYCVTARVEVNTPAPYFPYREAGRTCFPIGHFVTTLSTPELEYGIGTGSIRSVQECIIYERAPIFDRYVEYFWNLRIAAKDSGDRWLEEAAKRLLVSVYGKFGQRIWLTEVLAKGLDRQDAIWTEFDIPDREWYEYRVIAGRMERRGRQAMGRETLLAVPAHVTAYGRDQLWRWIMIAGIDHVYYTDTDGLICDLIGLRRLASQLRDHTLGGLRIVNQSPSLFIRAPKWYTLGDRRRRAGIKYAAEQIGWDRYAQDAFRSTKWALQHNSPGAALMDEVTVSAPFRGLLPPYSIGHRTDPLTLNLAGEQ